MLFYGTGFVFFFFFFFVRGGLSGLVKRTA